MSSPNEMPGPRTLRRANDVVAGPIAAPAKLFDEFWREGEMALLFGVAGAGKSLLATQISDALARGRPIAGLDMPKGRRRVLYVDLVLSDEQFAMRYSRETRRKQRRAYKFSSGLYRDRPSEGEQMSVWLRSCIAENEIDVVVIDDLSMITRSEDGTRETFTLVAELRRITRELNVSVLVLADSHPYVFARDITERELRRSRVLCAYADSVFAISSVKGTDRRNVIQTRSQAAELVWTHRNPARLNFIAPDEGFAGFEVEEVPEEQRQMIVKIKEMHVAGRHTFREIADALGMSKSTAARLYAKWRPAFEVCLHCEEIAAARHIAETEELALPDVSYDATEDGGEEIYYDFEDLLEDRVSEAETAERTVAGVCNTGTYCVPERFAFPADDVESSGSYASDKENSVVAGIEPAPEMGMSAARRDTASPHCPGGTAANSALHTPQSALKQSVDGYGREIFVEKEDERGRPVIWYNHDRRGRRRKHVRTTWGIKISDADHREISRGVKSAATCTTR